VVDGRHCRADNTNTPLGRVLTDTRTQTNRNSTVLRLLDIVPS